MNNWVNIRTNTKFTEVEKQSPLVKCLLRTGDDTELFTRLLAQGVSTTLSSGDRKRIISDKTEVYGKVKKDISGGGNTDRYPRSIQIFASDKQKTKLDGTVHSTQKPLALCEFLIKTYTEEGDLVLDNCSGSNTTAIAAHNLKRNFITIENDEVIYQKGLKRLEKYLL